MHRWLAPNRITSFSVPMYSAFCNVSGHERDTRYQCYKKATKEKQKTCACVKRANIAFHKGAKKKKKEKNKRETIKTKVM